MEILFFFMMFLGVMPRRCGSPPRMISLKKVYLRLRCAEMS